MTQEDKEKIIAEIERLRKQDGNPYYPSEAADLYYARGVHFTCDNLLRFINSLPDEPVSKDLEDAVNAYIGHKPDVDECSSVYGKRQAFKAGAQWKNEKFIDKACGWLQKHDSYSKPTELQVRDFRKYMEEEL